MDTREATRNYRLNQWTEIVRECRSSGQAVDVWCAENSIIPRNESFETFSGEAITSYS